VTLSESASHALHVTPELHIVGAAIREPGKARARRIECCPDAPLGHSW